MRINAFGFLVLAGTGLLVVGCGDDSGGGGNVCPAGEVECDGVCIPEIDPVLEGAQGIQENIFSGPGPTGSCAASTCHDAENPEQGLDLSSAAASAMTSINVASKEVAKNRVVPSDVDASYLFDKLIDRDIVDDPMPQLGFPLCDAKITAVEEWIAAGAPQ
jgi:hypothetical protein